MMSPQRSPDSAITIALRELGHGGLGLWLWLGALVASANFDRGRGDVLVPLAFGAGLLGLGLLLTQLHLPGLRNWHGWDRTRSPRPTPGAMSILVAFLPALALAALARGANDFWATRVAGLLLVICSGAALVLFNPDGEASVGAPTHEPTWIRRLLGAVYIGGLWLNACTHSAQPSNAVAEMTQAALFVGALALAGMDSFDSWRRLQSRNFGLLAARSVGYSLVSIILLCIVPSVCLLVMHQHGERLGFALLAAFCAWLGETLHALIVQNRKYPSVAAEAGQSAPDGRPDG